MVDAKGEAFDMSGSTVGFKLLYVRVSIPQLASDAGAVKFDPGT
jgi:hypothetical protein